MLNTAEIQNDCPMAGGERSVHQGESMLNPAEIQNDCIIYKGTHAVLQTLMQKALTLKDRMRDERAFHNMLTELAIDMAHIAEYRHRVRDLSNAWEAPTRYKLLDAVIQISPHGLTASNFLLHDLQAYPEARINGNIPACGDENTIWLYPCEYEPRIGHGMRWEEVSRTEVLAINRAWENWAHSEEPRISAEA
jgi:hypothetical protein